MQVLGWLLEKTCARFVSIAILEPVVIFLKISSILDKKQDFKTCANISVACFFQNNVLHFFQNNVLPPSLYEYNDLTLSWKIMSLNQINIHLFYLVLKEIIMYRWYICWLSIISQDRDVETFNMVNWVTWFKYKLLFCLEIMTI